MPPYEEYIQEIKDIWESHWLTNMGPKHNLLQEKLKDYCGVDYIFPLLRNGHNAFGIMSPSNEFEW